MGRTSNGAAARVHPHVVVSGTVENQSAFYDRFEHIVLLTAPLHVLLKRVSARTNNPYGTTTADRNEIAGYVQTVEPLLRRGATHELDGQRPLSDLVDEVEALLTHSP